MATHNLVDTSLAATSIGQGLYLYFQTADGGLAEISRPSSTGSYSAPALISLAARLINGASNPKAAKLFTPLAASTYRGNKYLFYVDDKNTLRDVYFSNGAWNYGTLHDTLPTQCAQYSKLAAVTLVNQYDVNFLCLYYQTSDMTADIKSVNYSPHGWKNGQPDLTDPPLFGTSLAAVKPEAGINIAGGGNLGVLFFQFDNLGLASSQNNAINQGFQNTKLSPHSALAAVDDGSIAHCFYTSDDNQIQRVSVDSNGALTGPVSIVSAQNTTPKSGITAVLLPTSPEELVLFYQNQQADLYASIFKQGEGLSFHLVLARNPSMQPAASSSGDGWSSTGSQRLT
ncbi:hypothetical protein CC78DRAFT_622564 [Lojkania enalia]|uniref:Fucose-specific lectin n=1 Tax=Lojkania enalia TaxID=147567 RepID=A0A9P4MU83_9PLEO|nr:hypothetical protein CC78DRAFT_622564 [Didymosphaeria enalia]